MKRVDLNNSMTDVAIRPTLSDPRINVLIGRKPDGGLGLKAVLYPDTFSNAEIHQKISRFKSSKNDDDCPVCQRYKAEDNGNKKMVFLLLGVIGGVVLCSYIGYQMKKVSKK